jgi:hypothetical protein
VPVYSPAIMWLVTNIVIIPSSHTQVPSVTDHFLVACLSNHCIAAAFAQSSTPDYLAAYTSEFSHCHLLLSSAAQKPLMSSKQELMRSLSLHA